MYRVVLECEGLPGAAGPKAAVDVAEEFEHRPWHQNVSCTWDGQRLRLKAENDYDERGLALLDEFSDAIAACVSDAQCSDLRVVQVTQFEPTG
ncbi:MAG TPA: hypothetical protein VMH80_06250 [Bryobacteraceae bacterium]|nr:hypothetical protein [Bryobacteraceae bacterium]